VFDALADVVRREGVSRIVVGLPLNADGSEGRQAKRARDFARTAERVVGVPTELWDERLSTRAAEDIVREQGRNMKRARQRGELDAVAAAAILQDYLDHHATSQATDWSARSEGQPPAGKPVEERDRAGDATDGPRTQTRLRQKPSLGGGSYSEERSEA
jgi:putative transcription antitermination factor YqgF